MRTTQTTYRSGFSSDSSLDSPLPRSRSLKKCSKKLSKILTSTSNSTDGNTGFAYSVNTTPPLDKAFAYKSMSPTGLKRATSYRKNIISTVKESWKAGVSPLSPKQEREFPNAEQEGAIVSPRHAPINHLQKAAAARNAVLTAPGRAEYLYYVQERKGPAVEFCSILSTMWMRLEEERLFETHFVIVDEGEVDARCFY